jgi:hypothetical protein
VPTKSNLKEQSSKSKVRIPCGDNSEMFFLNVKKAAIAAFLIPNLNFALCSLFFEF